MTSAATNGLDGRLAVVTGGGHGLGRMIATELARSGARIFVLDIEEHLAQETATLIQGNGGEACPGRNGSWSSDQHPAAA